MKKLFFYRIVFLSLLLISLSTPATAKTMSILVYPFENTGDEQYSWISAGMTDTVINDLMGIKFKFYRVCRWDERTGKPYLDTSKSLGIEEYAI